MKDSEKKKGTLYDMATNFYHNHHHHHITVNIEPQKVNSLSSHSWKVLALYGWKILSDLVCKNRTKKKHEAFWNKSNLLWTKCEEEEVIRVLRNQKSEVIRVLGSGEKVIWDNTYVWGASGQAISAEIKLLPQPLLCLRAVMQYMLNQDTFYNALHSTQLHTGHQL